MFKRFLSLDTLPVLVVSLGSSMVYVMAGNSSSSTSSPEYVFDSDSVASLDAAMLAWRAISTAESEDTARLWFVGANTLLGGIPPFIALRDGQVQEFFAAADGFLQGSWVA